MASMTPVSGATETAASPHVIDVENLENNNDNPIIDVEKECVKTPSPTRQTQLQKVFDLSGESVQATYHWMR